ncbi:hypothetical protein O3V59_22385 [Brevibacillus thermoruber]|uniref:Uncharacterized protein n=1 Tax=Brevibacillus thermoruber TaxID=33942 RepID=A0A9X3TVS1_9BACL|nr:hypothetical protein [Brevibacillus thermoruber]MDA5111083.1 hypothetical protein [Brevibacillus thermoruber]
MLRLIKFFAIISFLLITACSSEEQAVPLIEITEELKKEFYDDAAELSYSLSEGFTKNNSFSDEEIELLDAFLDKYDGVGQHIDVVLFANIQLISGTNYIYESEGRNVVRREEIRKLLEDLREGTSLKPN